MALSDGSWRMAGGGGKRLEAILANEVANKTAGKLNGSDSTEVEVAVLAQRAKAQARETETATKNRSAEKMKPPLYVPFLPWRIARGSTTDLLKKKNLKKEKFKKRKI
jgi:hypothetical protein